MKMKTLKALVVTVMTCSLLTGCSTFGSNTQATAATVVQETQIQHQAAIAALEAYCAVVEGNDSELQAVCDSVMPAALSSAQAVQTALSLLTAILARRSAVTRVMAASAMREAECHD